MNGVKWQGLLAVILFASAVLFVSAKTMPAAAETYPARPITIITPFAAGSATDTAARLIGKYLQESLGQPVVVENRDGAGGMLAAETVAHASPDGYTLLLTSNSTHSAAPALFKHVPYDPIKDFTPIVRVGSFPSFIAVTPDLPVKSMQELLAYAKANPGKINAGYGNSTGRITVETLKRRLNLDIVPVAYRSNPAAVTDLMGGHIQMGVPDFSTGLPMLKAGKIRGLAVLTKDRDATLPDLPTLDGTVMPGYDLLAWTGIFGPAGMPQNVVDTLAAPIGKTLAVPEVRDRFRDSGVEVYWIGPVGFSAYVKDELVKWTTLIKSAGIEPE
ncbi:MAG TPA: tripartite tricarboxylate transporter substrate binding protein [Xanthobacteraceae bacterium]|nr:tripartite tricarboxylate transporter substrate binding protein [Xanthobacteraceae bacterium]